MPTKIAKILVYFIQCTPVEKISYQLLFDTLGVKLDSIQRNSDFGLDFTIKIHRDWGHGLLIDLPVEL